jgi:glycosyltransferase involved in cell wall biosynthesis
MLLNHVLSNDTHSAIFTAIFDYFAEHKPGGWEVAVSAHPLPNADVHHYHRPHLESKLSERAVVTVHHDLRDPDAWLEPSRFLPRYREARRVICLSRSQQHFLAGHGVSNTVVIPHGFNERVLRPRPEHDAVDGPLRLGLFSTFYERRVKGEAYLYDLIKLLDPACFSWIVVGERRLSTAERLADLGYGVRLFEHLPYRLFQQLYESIDFLFMCSNFEGGPANIPEAVATGTPVLTTRVGLAPDFVEEGVNGFFLSGDPDADAERLMELVGRDRPLVRSLRAGAARVRERAPTWKVVVERQFAVYREMIGGGEA